MLARLEGGKKRVVSRRVNLAELVLRQSFHEARDSIWKRVLVAVGDHRSDRPLALGKRRLFPQLECSLGSGVLGAGVLGARVLDCFGREDTKTPRQRRRD